MSTFLCLFKWENQSHLKNFQLRDSWYPTSIIGVCLLMSATFILFSYFRHLHCFEALTPPTSLSFFHFLKKALQKQQRIKNKKQNNKEDCTQCSNSYKSNTIHVSVSMPTLSFFSPYNQIMYKAILSHFIFLIYILIT